MLQVPEETGRRFEAAMAAAEVAVQERSYYRKWLRYYLDFRAKYGWPPAEEASLGPFLEKPAFKNQSAAQRRQAAQAVRLCIGMFRTASQIAGGGGGERKQSSPPQARLTGLPAQPNPGATTRDVQPRPGSPNARERRTLAPPGANPDEPRNQRRGYRIAAQNLLPPAAGRRVGLGVLMATCTAILLLGEEDRYRSGIRPTEQLFYHESNPPFWTCRRFALGRMRDRRRERIPLRPHHVPPTPASPHLVTDALLRFLPHHSDAFERVEAHLEAIEEIMDRSISSCFRDMSAILSVAVARQHLDRARWALERAPFARKVVATLLWGAPDDAIVQNLERIHCVYEVCRAARAPARRRGP